MVDRLSILTHGTNYLAKVWQADGKIHSYDLAKHFTHTTKMVSNIGELSSLLSGLEKDPHSCIIRGAKRGLKGSIEIPTDPYLKGKVRRRNDYFEDQALHTVLIEVDNYVPLTCDPIDDPVGASEEYILSCLPEAFHGTSYHWQLSNSAGHPDNIGKLKIHLWFWLKEKCTSASLKKWRADNNVECDGAVFNAVQVHYTAAPILKEGVKDPAACRSGLIRGRDEVALGIDGSLLEVRKEKVRGVNSGEYDYVLDYVDILNDGEDGRVYIECPFKDGHSMESGPTSTVYFPKGTGGFEQGHFKCLHASCEGRNDNDFLEKCGALTFDLTLVEEDGKKTLTLPKFVRDNKGNIVNTQNNTDIAVESRPDICGFYVCYDSFLAGVLVKPMETEKNGNKGWRALKDTDYTQIQGRLELLGFKAVAKDRVRDAVHLAAELTLFDSLIDWCKKLPAWDGIPRIDRFFVEYFNSEDKEYTQAVGAYTWTALGGRALIPGIQADMMPILISKQGTRKSAAIKKMGAMPGTTGVLNFNADDDNRKRRLKGRCVLEVAEMQGMHTKCIDDIKAFITESEDIWRPMFKEHETTNKRRTIFIGTTNQHELLSDPTGARRFLPLVVGEVDPGGVANSKDQLWAEGLARFKKNGIEWQKADKLAPEEHEAHKVTDFWYDLIDSWLEQKVEGVKPMDKGYITTIEAAEFGIGLSPAKVKSWDQRKLGSLLREGFKFKRKQKRLGVSAKLTWVFMPTEEE